MAKLLTILASAVLFVGAIAFYRLPAGWVEPSFHSALTETLGPIQVTIPQAQMRWGGWRHPFGINVRQVALKNEETGLNLEIPNLLLSLKIIPLLWGKAEIGQCLFDSAKIYSKNHLLGEISGKAKRRGEKVSLQAQFQKVDATVLVYLFKAEGRPSGAALPFEGSLILEGSHKEGLSRINLECKTEGGRLSIPEIYPQPLRLDKAEFSVIGTGQTLSLRQSSVTRGDASLTVQGSIHSSLSWKNLYEKGGRVQISLEGKGAAIPVDDLSLLWPQGLSPKPRQWVVHQLSKGTANHVTTQMQGVISLDPGGKISCFEVPHIQGNIDASGITVDYFGKLPPVVDVKGNCHFTRQQFIIDAVGIANGILLKTAKIVIDDLDQKDQTIDIKLDLEGPVRNSLEIVNAEPLRFAQKLDLDPGRISGQARTHLHLAFPLETALPLDLINVKAQSQIKEGEILYETQLEGKPIKLDQGTFQLDVTKKSLEMKGSGHLQGVATQIQWQEYFADTGIPFRRQFLLKSALNLENLKNFGIHASDYLSGQAETSVHYTVSPNEGGVLEGFMDLTSAIMVSPVLSWQKEKGKPAHLKLKIRKDPHQGLFALEEASLIGPNLSMVGTQQGDVYKIEHLQIGKSQLKSTIQRDKQGIIQATIRGKVLDLSHILDDSEPELLIKPSSLKDSKKESEVKVNLFLDEVRLGKENMIRQVSGEMLYRQDTLMWAKLKGKARHNEESISLDMTPLSKDRQQFTLESGDGGHLLEMLGAGYDLEGGHLVIQGIKTIKDQGKDQGKEESAPKAWEIVGNITIDDFVINKAPLLARLLSAASLQGIVNIFSGRGIHFGTGEADFSLTPESLNLKKVRLISLSIGLILGGSIDRLHHKVNFAGELIPLYMINTFLARIPLIGNWISGGRDDGIFMTQFTLTGDRQDPDLAINPITTVTPGLMREFLMAQEKQTNGKTEKGEAEKQN